MSIADNEDRGLGYLFGSSVGGRERPPKIPECLIGLDGEVASADETAALVLGDLAGDEDQPIPGCDDCVGLALGRRVHVRIDVRATWPEPTSTRTDR